ncbi:hypothetical protein KKP04_07695 [Rhodomicrobium sp. Az07]|uniref:hypothetical protein n=1 Tax=Rhodomicrobium sp. Az07 TaxID=2839034 RepID=UPI001BE69C61|nr:hypothetical protein [Rhodomicrobium sp. Az07]MBT3070746.1 hypothetical protein [Rhodomicrobium sp. Az07]
MFLVPVPYFAYRELAAKFGEATFSKLLFKRLAIEPDEALAAPGSRKQRAFRNDARVDLSRAVIATCFSEKVLPKLV